MDGLKPWSAPLLTSTDFSFINDADLSMVMFYAPWCQHCQQFAPVWEQTSKVVKKLHGSKYKMARVDCTLDIGLCQREGVEKYPGLYIYKKGSKLGEFQDEHNSKGILREFDYWSKPAGQVLTTQAEVDNAMENNQKDSLIFFSSKDDDKFKKSFKLLADSFRRVERKIQFYLVENEDITPPEYRKRVVYRL